MLTLTEVQGKRIIWIGSIALPLAVMVLYYLPKPEGVGESFKFLTLINAIINGLTAVFLVLGFIAIKNKKIELHRKMMFTALILSLLFLVCYVLYHSTNAPTKFGGEGIMKGIYYFLLLTHIVLAAAIVPLVLITVVRALSEKFDRHRKIARIALPLWLYVSVTGVIVYLMIAPYYS